MLLITKLQNLKAIHNGFYEPFKNAMVVINHKTTKFESNSQHAQVKKAFEARCYQSQNYKIWKQFTTCNSCSLYRYGMLSITKLQNLKAIHNAVALQGICAAVVINHKTTKFESNSQPLPKCSIFWNDVINHKTTKFESNSQLK